MPTFWALTPQMHLQLSAFTLFTLWLRNGSQLVSQFGCLYFAKLDRPLGGGVLKFNLVAVAVRWLGRPLGAGFFWLGCLSGFLTSKRLKSSFSVFSPTRDVDPDLNNDIHSIRSCDTLVKNQAPTSNTHDIHNQGATTSSICFRPPKKQTPQL